MFGMFYGCSGLTSLSITNINYTYKNEMINMFYDCNLILKDLKDFSYYYINKSLVSRMDYMFYDCKNLRY